MLQHVSVEIAPDAVEDCVRFYELIGFAQVEPPGSLGDSFTWVERHGTQVHLIPREDAVHPPKGHLAVVVDDYDGVVARLRERGFEVDPRKEHWGAPRSFVRDPAGNRVELMAAPPT